MSKFLKIAVTVAAISFSVAPAAFAASAGTQASCEESSFTLHGVWDCR